MAEQLTKKERRNQMVIKVAILGVIGMFVLGIFASLVANMGS